MAILYGTQSNGETLPVEVNEFGQLIAKGIEGEQGPPGPPGIGQLPPDPFEGAILGWEDGELAWLGGSVPLPAGTFGPYVYDESNQELVIPQNANTLVNGQQLIMSDSQGNLSIAVYSTDVIASVVEVPVIGDWYVMASSPTNLADVLANGTPYIDGQQFQGGEKLIRLNNTGPLSSGSVFSANGTSPFNLDSSTGDGWFSENGTSLTDVVGSYGAGEWISWVYSDAYPVSSYYTEFTNSSVSYTVINVGFGTGPSIASIPGISLTFATSNNFDKFQVGDVVQGLENNEGPVTITAIEPGAVPPSIAVSGGDWRGADGSGSTDPDAQTELIAEWSGTGSVSVGLDGVIRLGATNNEWAEPGYYVTAPEQRIAVRKVAANARRLRKN